MKLFNSWNAFVQNVCDYLAVPNYYLCHILALTFIKARRAGYCHFPDLIKADAALCTAYCCGKIKQKE